ncbi:MAG TPA: hypothetical protein VH084_17530 [Mycobacterium sp.]|nr:hypothetical protein [Mycobacterium sp.]
MTSTLLIQDNTGDTRIEWDKNNATEVELARKNFDEHKAKRYLAYKTRADGSRGELLRNFDPDAERILMTPQLVGG